MAKEGQCKRRDCKYFAQAVEAHNNCDYMLITGHSRVKTLREMGENPADIPHCKLYEPYKHRKRRINKNFNRIV